MREDVRVFLSCSHGDAPLAEQIAEVLTALEIPCLQSVPWGEDVPQRIQAAIAQCSHIVVIFSAASRESNWVPYEVGLARAAGLTILPYLAHPWEKPYDFLHNLHRVSRLEELRDYFATLPCREPSTAATSEGALPYKPYRRLCGREETVQRICQALQDPEAEPVFVIHGMGGIGKTAVAHEVARRSLATGVFEEVIWLQATRPLSRVNNSQAPSITMTFDTVLDSVALHVGADLAKERSAATKAKKLADLLRGRRVLLVLDNMETAGEPQEEIVARLLEAFGATPLRVLLTSRKRSKYETSVSLRGLNVTGSREFLRQLGAMLGVPDLGEAPDADLDRIAIGVGGAPLAMRLVVGQMSYGAEIPQILERLRNIKLREGDSDEDDYANFYRSLFLWSWHLLSEPARELLLTLSWFDPFNGASGSRLLESSEIEPGAFIQAVEQLWSLSLLEVDRAGNGSQGSRYFLHSLTQHFAEEFAGG